MSEQEFLKVYPGWNVWEVWQVKDLPFSVMNVGLSPERQLRIWTEDKVRLGAAGAKVEDSIDFKGSQVELLQGTPEGLQQDQRKEQVPGPSMVVSGPAKLTTLRFFNRGDQAFMSWPHDESYLLERTFVPSPSNPATTGPAPSTIGDTIGDGITGPVVDTAKKLSPLLIGAGVLVGLYFMLEGKVLSNVKRKVSGRKPRAS